MAHLTFSTPEKIKFCSCSKDGELRGVSSAFEGTPDMHFRAFSYLGFIFLCVAPFPPAK